MRRQQHEGVDLARHFVEDSPGCRERWELGSMDADKGDWAADFPAWCDLNCKWAAFPKQEALDGAKSCRTFVALHCQYLDRIVAKNARCAAGGQGEPQQR